MAASQSYAEDSDSDWEDIHYVIGDSRKAIKFTENTLRKFRKDNMETGIFIDPSEYVRILINTLKYRYFFENLEKFVV